MAWELCTKEDVISIHPAKATDLYDLWSDAVESMIREHLGSPYIGKSVLIENERHSGDRTNIVAVNYPPITEVKSLSVEGVQLQPCDYVIGQSIITLVHQVFPANTYNVSVSYLSGTKADPETGEVTIDAVSPIVRLTAATMIVAIMNYKGRYGSDASIKWGDASQKEGESSENMNIGLTSHLVKIMNRMLHKTKLRVR